MCFASRLQLFEEMLAAKLVPNAGLFAMLITACERKVLACVAPHASATPQSCDAALMSIAFTLLCPPGDLRTGLICRATGSAPSSCFRP